MIFGIAVQVCAEEMRLLPLCVQNRAVRDIERTACEKSPCDHADGAEPSAPAIPHCA